MKWPEWFNPSGLLEGIRQGPAQASLVEAGFLWHQRQDQEMDWGLFQQNPAGGSWGWTLLHRLSHLRCVPKLHPWAISPLDLYQQSWWWNQLQPLHWWHHSLLSYQDPHRLYPTPQREAWDVWSLPPVWNLRAVIWFHFTIYHLVLLRNPVTLSVLSFFCLLVHSSELFPQNSSLFFIKR